MLFACLLLFTQHERGIKAQQPGPELYLIENPNGTISFTDVPPTIPPADLNNGPGSGFDFTSAQQPGVGSQLAYNTPPPVTETPALQSQTLPNDISEAPSAAPSSYPFLTTTLNEGSIEAFMITIYTTSTSGAGAEDVVGDLTREGFVNCSDQMYYSDERCRRLKPGNSKSGTGDSKKDTLSKQFIDSDRQSEGETSHLRIQSVDIHQSITPDEASGKEGGFLRGAAKHGNR